MNVQKLCLRGVSTHDATDIELPAVGVVLVTGPNGSGKSSIIEGVSCAGWGETLRGSPIWNPTKEAKGAGAGLVAEGVSIQRARVKGRTSLEWSVVGEPENKFETTTKAQEALERVIGSFEVWRRGHVFSSHDAAHFTLSTDAERKRLLETVLGLERFDTALKACRADLKMAATTAATAKSRLEGFKTRLAGELRRIEESKAGLAQCGSDGVGDAAEVDRLTRTLTDCRADLEELRKRIRRAQQAGTEFNVVIQNIQNRLMHLGQGACPTCEQPIPKALVERLGAEVEAKKADRTAEQKRASASLDEDEDEASDLEAQINKIAEKRAALSAGVRSAETNKAQRARFAGLIQSAEVAVAEIEEEFHAVDARATLAVAQIGELEAVEQVLGLLGLRAQVLGRALRGLEGVANRWLARIVRPGFQVKLTDTNDKIGLEITGAGGGHGYKGASGGERRRIDIAMMFALAEVASAANGKKAGTLWMDEVFDALDEEGVDKVVEALKDLSRERCVVVVSHNPLLSKRLPAVRRWHVEAGKITEG